MFEHFYAFIDEYGNENLETTVQGVSDYFIIAAVIAEDAGLDLLSRSIESIRKIHFQTGEMKSSTVGNNHPRRQRILESLSNTNLRYIILIVNKTDIEKTSGLGYKKTFRKFLPGMIYNRLYKTFSNITIMSDKHGGTDFMKSVKDYVDKKHKKSLFENQIFELCDSKDSVLIQAADFLAGTWAKILDPNISEDIRQKFKETIKEKSIFIDYWPPSAHAIFAKTDPNNYLNNVVRQQCYRLVQQYINQNHDTSRLDEEEASEMEVRLAALHFLLHQNEILDNHEFIYAKTIIEHLKEYNYGELTARKLASMVISPLRDSGVIIASGTKGYRIPTTVEDIIEFAKTTGEKVVPMIWRLGKARDQIHLASDQRLDIVNESGFEILNKFIELQKEFSSVSLNNTAEI